MATSLPSDVIYSNTLPLEAVDIYSKATELENRPRQAYENAEWLDQKDEFRLNKSEHVYWITYKGFNPAVEPLQENQDKDSLGYSEFKVGFTVDEYGIPVSWSKKAGVFTYTDPELQEKIRSILGPNMAETQDALCRNAMIDGLTTAGRVTYMSADALDEIPETGYFNTGLCEEIGEALLEDNNMSEGEVVCLGQRRAFQGITKSEYWTDIKKYANPGDIVRGEEGSWHNVRFARAPLGVLRNYGAITAQTAVAAGVDLGESSFTVDDPTGFEEGQLVTIGNPGGKDEDAEEVRISVVNAMNSTITIQDPGGLRYAHTDGQLVTEAMDLYPLIFMVRGIKPFGKGVVVPPYIGLTPPTDKMQRVWTLFWYSILGYGTIRPWAAWLVWVSAPPYTQLGRV